MSQAFDPSTLPLHGLRLIEASAGTGKTFSLAGLYLRLIVERNANVRDILVMTFTRAATQELRERIRARLADAARIAHVPEWARSGDPEHRFTQQILERSGQERAVLARRLADAAARVDEATIATIHGFAQRAANENAFESALAFDRGEQADDAAIRREATFDYWREHVFGGQATDAGVLALWPTPDALYADIAPVLTRPHVQLAGVDRERLDTLLRQLAEAWPACAESLLGILTSAVDDDVLLKSNKLHAALSREDDFHAALAALDQCIRTALSHGKAPVLPDWLQLLAEPAAQFKKAAKHQTLASELAALPAVPLLAELQPLTRLFAIDAAVAAVREHAEQRKLARRQYSYDDLVRALHDALYAPNTGAMLADALHTRWPYALVDEFQDTDPLQYACLRRIYLDRPREHGALLLIGDPKQAIYSFRGGDIYTYFAAARTAGDARYTLTTNYRSTQAVLGAIEALYRLPEAAPFVVPEIDFPRVDAGREAGDRRLVTADGELAALTFWHLHGDEKTLKNGKRQNPAKARDNERLTGHTVSHVGRLLDGRSAWWRHADGTRTPIAARDIAILVNNRTEATQLQAALARHGIMAVCQHHDSVFASGEAGDLRLILRAMAAPDDAMAVRAAQVTALIGKRLGDLIELADDDHAMQQAIERFHGLHETWAARGVLTALERLFMDAAPALLALTDGERRMSNYLQLGELLAGAEAECFGMASVVRWLDRHIETAAGGPDDPAQLRLESDADLVRISTVHAAKGLQYPIVLMPFALWLGAPSKNHPRDKPPYDFHDADGDARLDLVGDSANQQQAELEARSEALRLLYVALTRAEQAVCVGWRDPDDYGRSAALDDLLNRDGTAAAPLLNTLAARHPDTIAIEPLNVDDTPEPAEYRTPVDADTLTEARIDLPAPRPRWSTYSFSRLAHAAPETQAAELPEPGAGDEFANIGHDPSAIEDGALPRLDKRLSGVRFGSAVHDMLETWLGDATREPWPELGQPCGADQRRLVASRLRNYGLIGSDGGDPRIDDTAHLIARTLHTPLPEIGPLATLDSQRLRVEMAFMLRLRGNRLGTLVATLREAGYLNAPLGGHPEQTLYGLMQGFIDLVVEANGRYYVLDYKTNHLGDTPAAYNASGLQQAVSHAHYDLQYLIYSVALHRHLRYNLGEDYDPATHLGGVQYLFVRAMDGETASGIFTDQPDPSLVEALDELCDGEMENAIGS